jgi:hypothetical protein
LEETLKSLQETVELRKETAARLESQLMEAHNHIQLLQEENARLLDQEMHYRDVDDENIKVRQENYMLSEEVQVNCLIPLLLTVTRNTKRILPVWKRKLTNTMNKTVKLQ